MSKNGKVMPTSWDGGYVRYDASGRPTYYLRRKRHGKSYERSTRCHSLVAAADHLRRFEEDPEAYMAEERALEAGGVPPAANVQAPPTVLAPAAGTAAAAPVVTNPTAPLLLDAALAEAFLKYSEEEKGNTARYISNQRLYIADWAEDLAGLDLRRLTLGEHFVPALERRGARKSRIIAIKAFFGWLRKVRHVIRSAEDPTTDMPVPQSNPEKHVRRKIIPREDVLAVRPLLDPKVRDALDLHLATAWHGTELARFVKEGILEPRPANANPGMWPEGVGGVVSVKQKTGGVERWSLDEEEFKVAQRVRQNGAPCERWINRSIEKACKKAGVTVFTYGPLRHSVLTWAAEAGVSINDIAESLAHHKDPRTTRRFYVDVAVPKHIPKGLKVK